MSDAQEPDDDAAGRPARKEDLGGFKFRIRTVAIIAPLEGILKHLHDPPTLNLTFGEKLEARAPLNGNTALHVEGDGEGVENLCIKHGNTVCFLSPGQHIDHPCDAPLSEAACQVSQPL